ncbi:MAG: pentapeptide repeat-containing protein [Oscillospiraceae bacterium]
MKTELSQKFNSHREWLKSGGENGEQLILDNTTSEMLTCEQMQLLIDSVLIECSFSNIQLVENDFYHTEMHSCKFSNVGFCKTTFIKSEVNDTEFATVHFDNVNFSNSEFFDCIFTKCTFENSALISIGVWNSIFNECVFKNIDFDNAYLENATFSGVNFINPVNLDKATKITLNIGTSKSPKILSHENSINWIMEHSQV